MDKLILYTTDSEGDEVEREMPTKYAVCSQCEGKGTSSAYLGAFSGRRLEEARADEEFWDDYRSGRLDRACETCGGTRVVPVIDRKKCTKADLKAWDKQAKEEAEYQEMCRQERLFEGGWREEGWFDE
jgi:hypothetical protein